MRNTYNILVEEPEGKMLLQKLRGRCEENKMYVWKWHVSIRTVFICFTKGSSCGFLWTW